MSNSVESVTAVIDYIENHLWERLDLERVSHAVHYSKYYLHRMFVRETSLTIHNYVQRRQLTEAAKRLVFSDKPILEIALSAGYESQQAFTGAFKEMYKKTPSQYRAEEIFYPLQLKYVLNQNTVKTDKPDVWQRRIVFAAREDIPRWMKLVRLVIDGFPCLNEETYAAELEETIDRRQALILKDGDTAIGIMAFQEETGSIDFFGVHPQYRRQGIEKAFLRKMREKFAGTDVNVTITTFREGDRADTGYREMLRTLGFAEGELLVEFGYPTQRMVLQREAWEGRN